MRGICFDLDDTLYPYEQYVRSGFQAAADVFAAETGVGIYEELIATYKAGTRERTFDHVLERKGLPTEHIPAMVTAFHDRIGPLEPYPGVSALLEDLQGEYRLGLITDGRNGREKLAALGLESTFDSVWVSPERGSTKRGTKPFEATLADLGVDPANAAYVGDHPRIDVAVPNDLGMTTVRLRQGRYAERACDDATPDAELDGIDALPTTLTRLDRRSPTHPETD